MQEVQERRVSGLLKTHDAPQTAYFLISNRLAESCRPCFLTSSVRYSRMSSVIMTGQESVYEPTVNTSFWPQGPSAQRSASMDGVAHMCMSTHAQSERCRRASPFSLASFCPALVLHISILRCTCLPWPSTWHFCQI